MIMLSGSATSKSTAVTKPMTGATSCATGFYAKTLRKLKGQLFEQNRLVVEKGGTAVDTEYLEREIGFGFNHKLNQLDQARTAAIDAREDLEKGRAEFEEMRQAKDAAESRSTELEQLAMSAQLQVEQLSRDMDALREQLHQAQRYASSRSPTSSTEEDDLPVCSSSSRSDNSPGVSRHSDDN